MPVSGKAKKKVFSVVKAVKENGAIA